MARFLIALGCLGVFVQSSAAAEFIQVKNNMGELVFLWIWRDQSKSWRKPPFTFPKNEVQSIELVTPGQYWLVLRDGMSRDTHIGWFDLHEIHKAAPNSTLLLDEMYVQETTFVTVNECVFREETIETHCGRITIKVPVQVSKRVPVTVSKRVLTINIKNGEKKQSINEFYREQENEAKKPKSH